MFKKAYFAQINKVIVNIIFVSLDTLTDTSSLKFLVSFRFGSLWKRRDFFFFQEQKNFTVSNIMKIILLVTRLVCLSPVDSDSNNKTGTQHLGNS